MGRWIVGILLFIVGGYFLLSNLGIISSEMKSKFGLLLSVGLAAVGLYWTGKGLKEGRFYLLTVGSWIALVGGLQTGSYFGVVEFQYSDWFDLWPIVLVAFAVWLLLPKRMRVSKWSKSTEWKRYSSKRNPPKQGNMMIGSLSFNHPDWQAKSSTLSSAIVDYYMDFSKAYISEEEIHVVLKGWVGDVHVLIPEDLPVAISAKVGTGDLDAFFLGNSVSGVGGSVHEFVSPGYDIAKKRLRLEVYLSIGSVEIEKV
ncbi:cell wall-active antibiotics response protein LiaF [Bacillus fonticola]|uniref:cell wall-active antibiotics response protein LiaF n=1 Tax=Bacillus fonticola TaxID=2728853 RepID=UPI001476223A|nr:cell wall-active antibiotics response protein LiaF [Bacillus fonticola]